MPDNYNFLKAQKDKILEEQATKLDKALVTIINDWYSSWHRFAEEDEPAPKHIQIVLKHLKAVGLDKKLAIESRLLE